MKSILVFTIVLLSTGAAHGQGTINFNNFVVDDGIRAPVYGPEPTDPTVSNVGNTPEGLPAGTQTYGGPLLAGTGFTVQLWGIGGGNRMEGSLLPLETTTFRTGTRAGIVFPREAMVANAPYGTLATFQLRVWDNQGGTINEWSQALTSSTARGSSPVFSTLVWNGLPGRVPSLIGLRSFNLYVVPEPSVVALGMVGATVCALGFRRKRIVLKG